MGCARVFCLACAPVQLLLLFFCFCCYLSPRVSFLLAVRLRACQCVTMCLCVPTQVTAATESQFGHVELKLKKPRLAAPRLRRAAAFYLAAAQQALAQERAQRKATVAAAAGVSAEGEAEAAAARRRVWLARKAHALFTELGDLWLLEAKLAHRTGQVGW